MSNTLNQVNLNIDELKSFMYHIVKNNRYLQEQGKNPVAVEVIGESGIGKTSSFIQIAEELNLSFVKLNLSQIEELGDLVGYPIRQFELCKKNESKTTKKAVVQKQTPVTTKVKKMVTRTITEMEMREVEEFEITIIKKQVLEGGRFITKEIESKIPKMVQKEVPVERVIQEEIEEDETIMETSSVLSTEESESDCQWIDEPAIEEYIKRGYDFTGRNRMSYCPPEWIAGKEEGGMLLLDDYNRADMRFLQATMELIDRQEYISWKLPKNWHIVLSANPDNGDYLVNSIDNAQRTRFISVNLKYDIEIWAKWAEKAGIDNRCINFMLMHPELVTENVNARSITNFYNSISSIEKFEDQLPLIQMIGDGSVGPEFSGLFTNFINNKLDKMLNPKDILLHDNEAYIMGELRSTIGRDENYRADIASVIATRIINYSLFHAEKVGITQKEIDRLVRLVTDQETFANDIKYHMVKKLLNGEKQKFQKMMVSPEVIKMASK